MAKFRVGQTVKVLKNDIYCPEGSHVVESISEEGFSWGATYSFKDGYVGFETFIRACRIRPKRKKQVRRTR